MFKRIQRLPRRQRQIVFALLMAAALLGLVLLTLALILLSFNNAERTQGLALVDGVTVRELAVLPDDDAYPTAIAAGPDGVVYTGSFVSGAVWRITPDGTVTELPATRETIGAVAGLALAADGSLLVVDQQDADPLTFGGDVKRIAPDGTISLFAEGDPENGFLLPDDVTVDGQGRVYVTDWGRGQVWRFGADGGGGAVWWSGPANVDSRNALIGLAYDAAHDAILVTDSSRSIIYRVSTASAEAEILYQHEGSAFVPGFDGITAAPDGRVYVAAVSQNGVATLADGELVYVAGAFRGATDVDYRDGQIYVANFDGFSLIVRPVTPRLPFGIDVITLE